MADIVLSNGRVALVDDEDFERVNKIRWHHRRNRRNEYAYRPVVLASGKKSTEGMHRFILSAPRGLEVDHEDGNGLNNRRRNLRMATHTQNARNQRTQVRPKTSKFKGVNWDKARGKWYAHIKIEGKMRNLGRHVVETDAARAYNAAAAEAFGEFAKLNELDKDEEEE